MKKAQCWALRLLSGLWVDGVGEEDRFSYRYFREVCVSRYISGPVDGTSRLETQEYEPPVHALLIGSSWNVSMESVWEGKRKELKTEF